MALWRLVQLLAVAAVSLRTAQAAYNETDASSWNATTSHRRLVSAAPGNVAACYTPFHNNEYPLFGGSLNLDALRAAIEDDFRVMSKYFTHVRTYYAQHFGIEIAPIAAKFGVKLYLGAYLTSESWWTSEANAAANAIKNYPGTVEVVLTGNENLVDFRERSWDIINKINDIKARAGSAAGNVKYGTVQRINEFVDARFNWDMQQLNSALDILGVNIYPFFTNSYDGNRPAALLDAQWQQVTSKYPSDKIRLTETGYPTAGGAPWQAPSVRPGLDASVNYYNGVAGWTPSGYENKPKFWFQAFDRRYGDPGANGVDYELYFGFLTTAKQPKRDGFPRQVQAVAQLAARTAACDIEENVDYAGSDVANKPAAQAESCFELCNAVAGCGAFTWSSFNGGTCWLKSGKGSSARTNGFRSGVACSSPSSSTACSIEENVDYSGADVGNRPATQADSCFALCDAAPGCGAFTWSSYNGGTCWLKANKGSARASYGARSGVAGCSTATTVSTSSTCSIEENADFSGTDVGSKQASRAESCFGLCNAFSGCGAFTWSNFNGGTCWFKSAKGNTKASSGARSGVACKCNLGGLEVGVDYSGQDVGNAYGANAEACVSQCQAKAGCRAFTWTTFNGGTCWFKASKGAANGNGGATSGVIC